MHNAAAGATAPQARRPKKDIIPWRFAGKGRQEEKGECVKKGCLEKRYTHTLRCWRVVSQHAEKRAVAQLNGNRERKAAPKVEKSPFVNDIRPQIEISQKHKLTGTR